MSRADKAEHIDRAAPARIIILTGRRGAGKTAVCRKTAALAQARGHTCGGILTIRRADDALDVLDVRGGHVRRLTVDAGATPAVIQGCFRFNPETLAWGNDVLRHAVPCHLLVVDELGPLEFERGKGWQAAFDVLSGRAFTLALVVVRPALIGQAELALASSAATVFNVTVENRDRAPQAMVEMLDRALAPAPKARPS